MIELDPTDWIIGSVLLITYVACMIGITVYTRESNLKKPNQRTLDNLATRAELAQERSERRAESSELRAAQSAAELKTRDRIGKVHKRLDDLSSATDTQGGKLDILISQAEQQAATQEQILKALLQSPLSNTQPNQPNQPSRANQPANPNNP